MPFRQGERQLDTLCSRAAELNTLCSSSARLSQPHKFGYDSLAPFHTFGTSQVRVREYVRLCGMSLRIPHGSLLLSITNKFPSALLTLTHIFCTSQPPKMASDNLIRCVREQQSQGTSQARFQALCLLSHTFFAHHNHPKWLATTNFLQAERERGAARNLTERFAPITASSFSKRSVEIRARLMGSQNNA